MKKKILSTVLAGAMVLSLVPVSALAAGDGSDTSPSYSWDETNKVYTVSNDTQLVAAIEAANPGDSIVLNGEIELEEAIELNSDDDITVIGNGYSISFAAYSPKVAFTGVGDNNLEGIPSGAKLKVSDVTFKNTSETNKTAGYAALINFNAYDTSVDFEDCTFENLYCAVYANPVTSDPAQGQEYPTISIKGSTFTNTTYGYSVDEMTPGAIVGVVETTFTDNGDVTEKEAWKNVALTHDGKTIARESLTAALDAAEDGDTITLGSGDYELNEAIVLGKQVAIQGAGEDTVIVGSYKQDYGNGLFTFTGGSEGSVLRNMTIKYTEAGAQQAAVYFDGGFTDGSAEDVTEIQNVHFIGGESLETIGGAIAISSTYITGGYVEVSGCIIENFKYGMYFNAIHDLTISGNTINGTSYNAINIAGDSATYPSENITITGNTMTNISNANYEFDEYSCGIRLGSNASNITLTDNTVSMLNGKLPIYVDQSEANAMVTVQNEAVVLGQKLVAVGSTYTLPDAPEKTDYTFKGWQNNLNSEVYAANTVYTVTADTTFTAVWAENFTVTVMNGDTQVATAEVADGNTYTLPAAPTKVGYRFEGWSDGTNTHEAEAVVTINGDTTFTALWQRISSGGSSSGGSSSGSTTETVTNPDGSTTTTVTKPDGTVTETTKQPDGSTTTTVTEADGSKTVTTEATNGASSVVTIDKSGRMVAEVKVPNSVVTEAAEAGEAVALPMDPVTVDETTVTVDLPANTTAKVEIPVDDVTAGTVAVLVKADGTEQVIKTTVATQEGLVVALSDGDTVKIVDNAKEFVDVSDSHWAAEYVDFATSRELFAGTSETTFSPDAAMTRAMIWTVLASYDGANTVADQGEAWYAAGQQWAMENGISDGTAPNNALTREQLAVMLWSYAGRPAVSGDLSAYTDADSASDWAAEALAWAVDNGLISGMGDGVLNPQGQATRAQLATIMSQFVKATV